MSPSQWRVLIWFTVLVELGHFPLAGYLCNAFSEPLLRFFNIVHLRSDYGKPEKSHYPFTGNTVCGTEIIIAPIAVKSMFLHKLISGSLQNYVAHIRGHYIVRPDERQKSHISVPTRKFIRQ